MFLRPNSGDWLRQIGFAVSQVRHIAKHGAVSLNLLYTLIVQR